MSERPTIALLIPAYNAAAFLPRLLKSAAEQSPAFDEVWIHDDCSFDDTAAVGRALGASVYTSSTNVGCTAGKARLLTLTKCDWVHFHDADDELLPGFTAAAIKFIQAKSDVDVIITGTEELSETDSNHRAVGLPNPSLLSKNAMLFSVLYKVNAICGIYRRSFLLIHNALSINDVEKYNEDQAIQINIVTANANFGCIPVVLVRSYKQSVSMSQSNAAKCARSHMHVMLRALASEITQGPDVMLRKAVTERLWAVVATAASSGDMCTAEEAAMHANRIASIPRTAGGMVFRTLARIHPRAAIRLRELFIRTFKPWLRPKT